MQVRRERGEGEERGSGGEGEGDLFADVSVANSSCGEDGRDGVKEKAEKEDTRRVTLSSRACSSRCTERCPLLFFFGRDYMLT